MATRGQVRRLRRSKRSGEFECLYCGDTKSTAHCSFEHVWPDSLGGDFGPDWFKTANVCTDCNRHCGLVVDGEFVATMFMTTELLTSALAWLDISRPQALPLVYMGRGRSDALDCNEECDFWLGARGETIYHFRDKSEAFFDTHAGGHPKRRRINPGRTYMSFCNPNLFWILSALLSVEKKFKNASRYSLTQIQGPLSERFATLDERAEQDKKVIAELSRNQSRPAMITMNTDYGRRLLCKLGLGFGYELFGPRFLQHKYVSELRSGLNAPNPDALSSTSIRMQLLIAPKDDGYLGILNCSKAFTFTFMRHGDDAHLTVATPSGKHMGLVFCENARSLESPVFDALGGAFSLILVPHLKKCFGPYALPVYTNHRLGFSKIPELTELEDTKLDRDTIEEQISERYPVVDAA